MGKISALTSPRIRLPSLSKAVHWHHSATGGAAMPRNKDETLSIRTTGEIKALLREAAEHERRSVASMMEILVLDYAKTDQIAPSQKKRDAQGRQKGHTTT